MLEHIDLNLLVVFEALMVERNVTRAGARLGRSQPATSAALARLRALMADDLFVRGADGLRVATDAARAGSCWPDRRGAVLHTAQPAARAGVRTRDLRRVTDHRHDGLSSLHAYAQDRRGDADASP
ncbi:LysR family transcriptional regulator [Acetobacter nitrogenifigens]|uniref:LysR family transcriptional regulator n=1 Tax=Acetobacter nitrogenifigens TaxID=285268 RepID=UPI001B7FE37E|nr:LysR family transcriptional regulator [Acetobacter nitrogenifigens]